MAEAAEEPFERRAVADELRLSPGDLRGLVEHVEGLGLALGGEDERPPVLMRAGRQFLRLGCVFDEDALGFLPRTIDDLFARRALLCGGSVLVDTLRGDLIAGKGVEHAREIVPPAFDRAVDEGLALNLFAAAVSLMTRLSTKQPAGYVAEEVIAVSLINEARAWLELEADSGELLARTAAAAIDALPDLFALFEDDDVLRMFDMREPADAALDGVSDTALWLGVADQRLEAWFIPFGGVAPTGYLDDRPQS